MGNNTTNDNQSVFNNSSELYEYLDLNSHTYPNLFQIGKIWKKLRDLLHEQKETIEADKAQTELEASNFDIRSGELSSLYGSIDKDGKNHEWPNIGLFDKEKLEYLKERIKNVLSPILKARYSHILWESSEKNIKYAEIAIDSYMESVDLYRKKGIENPKEHFEKGCEIALETSLLLALIIKDSKRIESCKIKLFWFLSNINKKSSLYSNVLIGLLTFALENRKIFDISDFEKIKTICISEFEYYIKQKAYFQAIDIAKAGLSIDEIYRTNRDYWLLGIASSYEILCEIRGETGDLAAIDFCLDAIKYYKILKDEEKETELVIKYEKLIKEAKYGSFSVEQDISDLILEVKKNAENIVIKGEEHVIKYLMYSQNLLPNHDELRKNVKENKDEFSFMQLVSNQIVDELGHTAQHFTDEDENEYFSILQQYKIYLELNTHYLLKETLYLSIKGGTLNFNGLVEKLKKSSWLSKELAINTNQNEELKYNWLQEILPGIYEYFYQLEYHFKDNNFIPNFVLSIDSLTMKIEGMLRDMCRYSGISVTNITKDKQGRKITKVKDIHMLLFEKPVRELFSADDLLLFRYVLVEQAGYNLRHKIAHGMMFPHDYSLRNMNFILLIIIRIAKYDFNEKEEGEGK